MAERRNSGVVYFYCPHCLKNLDEIGDLVPRKLPCSHTLCERCLQKLLRDNSVRCPECRRKHTTVNNDVKTFPQDKRIVINIRRKNTPSSQGEVQRLGSCSEHGKELILFCNSVQCNKPVCQRCLTLSHRGHDVVDLDEKEGDLLLEIDSLTQSLLKGRKGIQAEQAEILRNNTECLNKLKAKKDEHVKAISQKYDVLLQRVVDENSQTNKSTSDCIECIDEHVGLLNHIKAIVKRDGNLAEELISGMETVSSIAENVTVQLKGRCFQYNRSPNTDGVVDSVWGFLTQMDRQVVLNGTKSLLREDTRQNASEFKCRVIAVICTDYKELYSIHLVGITHVVVLGSKYKRKGELAEYSFRTGAKTQQVEIEKDCNSLAGTSVGAKACVAVSYENQKLIEFRALTEFNRVVHRFSMSKDNPHSLWTSSPTNMLNGHQICILLNPFRVKQLNFGSFLPPTKLFSGTSALQQARQRQASASTSSLQMNSSSSTLPLNSSPSSSTLPQRRSMFASTSALQQTKGSLSRSTSFQEARELHSNSTSSLPQTPLPLRAPQTPQLTSSHSTTSLSPLKLMAEGYVMAAWDSAHDLCCVKHGEKLVLITAGVGRVNAYDASTMKIEWKVEGYLPGVNKKIAPSGVTTNERGHLFVCDRDNACIHIFRIPNGKYMGMVLREGDHGMGIPEIVRWCEDRSSLIVAHQKENTWSISVVKLE